MKTYICNEDGNTHFNCKDRNGECIYADERKKCNEPRYVRADVAIRYARMRERKGYEYAEYIDEHLGYDIVYVGYDTAKKLYGKKKYRNRGEDEAIAEQQKEKAE